MNPPPVLSQTDKDEEHLKLLSIFHYVVAGMAGLGVLFLIGHFAMMNAIMFNPAMWQDSGDAPPQELKAIIRVFYLISGLIIVAVIVLNILCARDLKTCKNRALSLIVSGINCLNVPLGTLLGIFTIIVLMRPTVIERYQRNSPQ